MEGDSVPRLGADGLGQHEAVLETGHLDAVDRVRSAFTDVGFRVATMFSPSERIAQHRDAELDPYHVIGFGVPAAGDHALTIADERVGTLFPCNVVVWEDEPGAQHVYHLNTMRVAGALGFPGDDESWGTLVAQLERMVDDAFAQLEGDGGG